MTESDPITTGFDPGEDSVTAVLLDTIASFEGRSPDELPPLVDVVDPEALDALFRYRARDDHPVPTHVMRFEYDDYQVQVHSEGVIRVCSSGRCLSV
jgi:hypothetical protein